MLYFLVDYVKFNLLDYPKTIKKPMDFGTVKNNLEQGKYVSAEEFEKVLVALLEKSN